MQDIFNEQLVKRNGGLQTEIYKALIIGGGFLLMALLFFLNLTILSGFGILMLPLVFLVPFLVYALIKMLSLEYEYIVTNEFMDIDQIRAKKKRQRLISFDISAINGIGIYKPGEIDKNKFKSVFDASKYITDEDIWYLTLNTQKTGNTLILLSPNEKILAGIKTRLSRDLRSKIPE